MLKATGTPGIKVVSDSKGVARKIEIDAKKVTRTEEMQDFLDGLEIDAGKGKPTIPWEKLEKKLKKKHGWKK